MFSFKSLLLLLFLFLSILPINYCHAQPLTVSASADLVSRYVWRGMDLNDMPHVQPSLTFTYNALQCGFWGSYGLTHLNSTDDHFTTSQEIDTWVSYGFKLPGDNTITLIATDYYYCNAGIRLGNFNNYNDSDGPGSHLIEGGLTFSGSESFPFSFSCFVNAYNDEGKNIYLQANYSHKVQEITLDAFVGATPGSTKTPGFYGSENFSVINIGIKATKQIKISENYLLPAYCAYAINPKKEQAYLFFGVTF